MLLSVLLFLVTKSCSTLLQPLWTVRSSLVAQLVKNPPAVQGIQVRCQKVGLKLKIQKTKIMASGPITSWEIDGETVEIVFWDPKSLRMVTAAMKLKDTYSLEGKL